MNLTPIQSNSPTPQEPERSRVTRRPESPPASTPARESEAVKARGLVAEIGQRLEALRADAESRKERVGKVLEEVRRGHLLSRANLEQSAEAMLFGEDPESVPLD
jgi:hypothetical protein